MSEQQPETELVDVDPWLDELFPGKDGKPLSGRTKRAYIQKFRLPVVKVGWKKKINPQAGARQLLTFAQQPLQQQPPRRKVGRPRKFQTAAD